LDGSGDDRACGRDRRRRSGRADVGGRAGVGERRRRHRGAARQPGSRRLARRRSALTHGIGGVIQAGRLGAASPLVGESTPLDAAAAVLLGGTSFLGGLGGVTGTAVGVLFIGTLQNGLSISGVSSFWQQVVTGVILILAIAIDLLQQTPGGRWRRLRAFGHGPTSTSEPRLEESQGP